MYEAHFGLSAPPFQLTPDPGFYFDSQGHRAMLRVLRETLSAPRGHLVVSGEIGAGKTLVTSTLVSELDPARFVVARLVSTQLDADDLVRAVAGALALEPPAAAEARTGLQRIDTELQRIATDGKRLLLLIDEAQNLGDDAFARLGDLDALPANAEGTLVVVLVGQPELRQRLAQPNLAAFARHIAVECHLRPLSPLECGAYIAHRLEKVGWTGRPRFDAAAIDAIYRFTDGIPRRINQICNRLMLAAFLQEREQIDLALVAEVTAELRDEIGDAAALSALHRAPVAATPAPVAAAPVAEPAAFAALPPAMPPPVALQLPLVPLPAPSTASPASPPDSGPLLLAPLANDPPPAPAPLSLHLLPIDDMVPSTLRAELRDESNTRFPAFAPWPTVPEVVPPPLSSGPPTLDLEVPARALRGAQILCVAGGVSEHAQAAVLLRALRAVPNLPPARLVRAFANDALERTARLFYPRDREQLLALSVSPAGSHAERAADLVARFDALLAREAAEVVILFDGGEAALACALAASRRKVPVLRVGAGRRAKDGAVSPADLKRKLSDQMADMLYTADAEASAQVGRDGLPASRVSLVGSVLSDALQLVLSEPGSARLAAALETVVARVGRNRPGYAVALIDSRAHLQDRRVLAEIVTLLADISRDLPILWPMPASTREQLLGMGLGPLVDGARIVVLPMQTYADFARLVADATCVVTDSWTLQEESTILEVPCITVGTAPAHPATVADGTNIDVGLNRGLATRVAWDCIFTGGKRPLPPRLWDGRAADRIAVHLAGWLSRTRTAQV
jgi:general secretion pathway protein A